MKEEIEAWKKKNGNSVSYSIKELLYGIHEKLDKQEDRLRDGDKELSSLKTWNLVFRGSLVVIFTILCYLIFV